jgi:two-component system response regulator AtoC
MKDSVATPLVNGECEIPHWPSKPPEKPVCPNSAWNSKGELLIPKVSSCNMPVLIRGETGVGKEVLARRIHAMSQRANGPFLKLNCAALPAELVESELFGYEKGAFTGAAKTTPGKFQMADGGTIFLDEIGDMDFKLQAKFLQVLQDHEFLCVGGHAPIKVDVRVIAATHCNLEEAVEEKRFREDLYYRLNVIEFEIPPLRERRDEILGLAEHFLSKYSGIGMDRPVISNALKDALIAYHWPGNIRELENVMRRFIVLGSEEDSLEYMFRKSRREFDRDGRKPPTLELVKTDTLSMAKSGPVFADLENLQTSRIEAESATIVRALNQAHWNRRKAAALLKIDYKALLYRMKKFGIGPAMVPNEEIVSGTGT